MRHKLTIGYSALASRAANIVLPENQPETEAEIIICIQLDIESYKINKSKAQIIEMTELGVAKSRNSVIAATTTDYLVFADDDVEIISEGQQKAIEYLEQHPEVSVVLCQVLAGNKPRKNYPKAITKLHKFNSAKAATPEVIIRVKDIKENEIFFDENFGAGAKNFLGDEYIFVCDCLDKKLVVVSLPIAIARHEELSSGNDWSDEKAIAARAKVFERVFGKLAFVAKLGFVIKNFRRFGIKGAWGFLVS